MLTRGSSYIRGMAFGVRPLEAAEVWMRSLAWASQDGISVLIRRDRSALSTMGRHSKKGAVWEPGRGAVSHQTLTTLALEPDNHSKLLRLDFCRASYLAYGILSWRPKQTRQSSLRSLPVGR